MGNIYGSRHKSTLTAANECYISYSNFIFDLKTMAPITNAQISQLLFTVNELQNSFNSLKIKTQHDQEQMVMINKELENINKTIGKYNPKWGKQERLDFVAILTRSNILSDICGYLENLNNNKNQPKSSRACKRKKENLFYRIIFLELILI
jgi:hypothetical protein